MIDLKDILFAPLKLPISNEDIRTSQEEHKLKEIVSFYSEYRTCRMIPLRTSLGSCDPKVIADKNQTHEWTANIQYMPHTKKILEEHFLPIVGENCRIITLCTPPHSVVKAHYDCSEETYDQVQLKMRLVIKGETDSLWFLGPNHNKIFTPKDLPLYVINGAHPHGAVNKSDEEKMTICLGGHFTGMGSEMNRLLEESYLNQAKNWITHQEVPRQFIKKLFQKNYEKTLALGEKDNRLGIDP